MVYHHSHHNHPHHNHPFTYYIPGLTLTSSDSHLLINSRHFMRPIFWGRGQVFTETYTFVDHVSTVSRHVHFILPSVSLFLESFFRFYNWEHLLDGVEFLFSLVIEKRNGRNHFEGVFFLSSSVC